MNARILAGIWLLVACASLSATPLTLEYTVSSGGPPYTYTFRLVLDNHDNTWQPGMGWNIFIFGQAPNGTATETASPFASWSTNSASYPIGPFNTTFWFSQYQQGAGLWFSGPELHSSAGGYWQPTAINQQLTWWGTANASLGQGELGWTGAYNGPGGPPIHPVASFDIAKRLGAHLFYKTALATQPLTVPRNFTGGGNGFSIGTFEVGCGPDPVNLTSLTLEASGTGDDSAAFSEIGLFRDTNNNGVFDPGVDTRFGAAYSGYPSDNGSLTFTDSVAFSGSAPQRFFIVAKLSGLAGYGTTFHTRVLALNGSGGPHTGFPGTVINGVHIQAPTLTLTSQVGSTAVVAANDQGPTGIGRQVGDFTLTNDAVDNAYITSISITGQGSMDDAAHFSEVSLYEDTNINGAYDAADTLVGSFAAFPADGGTLLFAGARTFSMNQSRRFFVVTKLNGNAPSGRNFYCRVEALGLSGGTETVGVPGNFMYGLQISGPAPDISITRLGAIALGGTDNVNGFTAGQPNNLIYTIGNPGAQVLNLATPVAAPLNLVNCTAAILQQPSSTVVPSASTLMIVEITPLAAGPFSCSMWLNNDAPLKNPYTWTISGNAAAPLLPDITLSRSTVPVAIAALDNLGSAQAGVAQSVTYTISNPGTGSLSLTGTPLVEVLAITNISAVTITINPAAGVAASGYTTFTVSYTVAAAGAFEFALSISNNTVSKNPYYWSATGSGLASAPEIEIARGAVSISNGGSDALGQAAPGATFNVTYTISNTGTATLNISGGIIVSGANCSASIVGAPAATAAPSTSTTMVIAVTATATGPFSFSVSLGNDDSNENPYGWTVDGTGVAQGGGSAASSSGCTTDENSRWAVTLPLLAVLLLLRRRRISAA